MSDDVKQDDEIMTDRIEVTVPAASLVIRHARCSHGCLLMEPEVPINDHPSIHVKARLGEKEWNLYLDATYGSFDIQSEEEIDQGAVIPLFCPHCGVSLQHEDVMCQSCSAPLFLMHLPHGGSVEGCTRRGCFSHRLEIIDLEAQLLRLYEETQMDAFL